MSETTPILAAAILAGGQASRYGGMAKGLLEIAPGVSIMGRLIAELRAARLTEIVVAANTSEPYQHLGLGVLADLRPPCGPLGGVEAALSFYGPEWDATLFLPCDLPAITRQEIVRLRGAFVTSDAEVAMCVTGDGPQPLCAVVRNRLLPEVRAALEAGELSARRLWRRLGAVEVPFAEAAPFHNVNCPEDFDPWLSRGQPGVTYHAERAAEYA